MQKRPYGLLELSAVQELSNIGLGHATTALAELTGISLLISVATVDLMQIETFPSLLGGPEVPAVAVAMNVVGELGGTLAFILAKSDSDLLARSILGVNSGVDGNREIRHSILLEVGNIIDSSYLNAISEMTGTTTVSTVPVIVEDMAGTVVSSIAAHAAETGESAIIFQIDISDQNWSSPSFFVYIPTAGSMDRALRSLGIQEAA